MRKITPFDRILLLITGFLAAYQVAEGMDGYATVPIIAYTFTFGIILVASLLLIILGFSVLDSPAVVILSTIIPLSLSLGLIWQYLPTLGNFYLVFSLVGFLAVLITRIITHKLRLPTYVLAFVHGIAGLIIVFLPFYLSIKGITDAVFSLVGIGGILIGVGGLFLFFLKTGNPILSKGKIYQLLPGILLLMTTCFVVGFHFG